MAAETGISGASGTDHYDPWILSVCDPAITFIRLIWLLISRIADEGEMKLLKQDIAHQIVEEYHRQKDPAFIPFCGQLWKWKPGKWSGGYDPQII